VHDNQCLGWGVLGLHLAGIPVLATVHHTVVIDRDLELAVAPDQGWRLALRRWYQFHNMQARVARRLPAVITVSSRSREDIITRMRVRPERPRRSCRRGNGRSQSGGQRSACRWRESP